MQDMQQWLRCDTCDMGVGCDRRDRGDTDGASARFVPAIVRRTLYGVTWALLGLLILGTAAALAHDIPTDVRILAFVRPEAQRLQLLVRVPLAAMNEVDMPLRGPGFIDLARADAALRVAAELWFADNLTLYEDGRVLPRPRVAQARVSIASDASFAQWDSALAHMRAAPIPPETDLYWKQQHFDVLLEVPVVSARSRFSIDARFARMGLRVQTTLRVLPADGAAERLLQWHGNPGLVHLDPHWYEAVARFVVDGMKHILGGLDHVLFIACLALATRRLRSLVVLATAFTVAHSVTLLTAALGGAPDALWFAPLVEVLIAASIIVMALEAALGTGARWRWMTVFAFGLVHGFGLAVSLAESLQYAGSHLVASLAAFNIGVELGQIGVLLLLVPLLRGALRVLPERAVVIVLAALIVHQAWHWLAERFESLRQFPWPQLDAAGAATLAGWAMAAVLVALGLWLADRKVRRWMGEPAP